MGKMQVLADLVKAGGQGQQGPRHKNKAKQANMAVLAASASLQPHLHQWKRQAPTAALKRGME